MTRYDRGAVIAGIHVERLKEMDEEVNERRCSKAGCTNQVTKQMQYLEPAEVGERTSEGWPLNAPVRRLNLCEEHLPEARKIYRGRVTDIAD